MILFYMIFFVNESKIYYIKFKFNLCYGLFFVIYRLFIHFHVPIYIYINKKYYNNR